MSHKYFGKGNLEELTYKVNTSTRVDGVDLFLEYLGTVDWRTRCWNSSKENLDAVSL